MHQRGEGEKYNSVEHGAGHLLDWYLYFYVKLSAFKISI